MGTCSRQRRLCWRNQGCKELTEGMKENLIDKVFVYEGVRIEIVWGYGDCLEV